MDPAAGAAPRRGGLVRATTTAPARADSAPRSPTSSTSSGPRFYGQALTMRRGWSRRLRAERPDWPAGPGRRCPAWRPRRRPADVFEPLAEHREATPLIRHPARTARLVALAARVVERLRPDASRRAAARTPSAGRSRSRARRGGDGNPGRGREAVNRAVDAGSRAACERGERSAPSACRRSIRMRRESPKLRDSVARQCRPGAAARQFAHRAGADIAEPRRKRWRAVLT